jgi:hypothetical protein
MIRTPDFTGMQLEQLKSFAIIYTVWSVMSVIGYYYILSDEHKWIAYGPAVFLLIAFVITGVIIISRKLLPNISLPKNLDCVYIKGKRVTCCQYCKMAEIKDNIVNNKFPVVKCRETAKVCYNPMKIPRWCPYAKK